MINITIGYECLWRLSGNEKYLLSKCGEVINLETSTIIKKSVKGAKVGYYIDGKFIDKTTLRGSWQKIPKLNKCPFGSGKY